MIEYKLMTAEHIEQVAQLEKLCFSSPWSENSIRGELTNPLSLWVVATEGEKLAGYAGSQTVLGEADMMNLAVEPAFRRQGIGRELVTNLVARLKEKGTYCLTLEVRASNVQAIGLYQQLMFEEVGRRPNYYSNPKEDALILRKNF